MLIDNALFLLRNQLAFLVISVPGHSEYLLPWGRIMGAGIHAICQNIASCSL